MGILNGNSDCLFRGPVTSEEIVNTKPLPSLTMKLARVAISPSVLIRSLRDGWRATSGLPLDAEYRWAWYDPERQVFWVVCGSESFAEVPEGEIIPELYPAISALKEDTCPHS